MAATESERLPGGIRIRPLGPQDIGAGLALSEEAGWNQIDEDWAWMIRAGRGWACTDETERVVATALTLPGTGAFGWISMVLVTGAWQRRGIASALMARSIEALKAAGKVPGLDATPAGRTVYGPLGFNDIYGLTRFRAEQVTACEVPAPVACRPMTAGDLSDLAALDRQAFGADRLGLLADLLRRAPARAWVSETGDGFCLGRDGRGAGQLGPVVAERPEVALALAKAALGRSTGPVMIDVPDHHAGFIGWLERSGFAAQRPYTRMLLGRSRPADDPERVFAITGPELG
jgi:GNAT superfamily N-acetyltransferase